MRNGLEKDISEKIAIVFSEKSREQYVAKKQEVAKILASLVEQIAAFDVNALNDDDLVKMDSINKEAKRNINRLNDEIADIYFNDLKIKAGDLDNQITDEHNQLKKVSFAYNTALQKFNDRLEGIKTSYTFANDLEFQRRKDEISSQVRSMEKMNLQAVELRKMLNNADTKVYEKYNEELTKIIDQMKTERDKLQEQIDEFELKENTKIDGVIEIYKKEIEEKENKRLLEENTGSISVKKTGQKVKVSRDLDEIKNANDAVNNEEVKLLDFTKPKVQISKESSSSVGVVKKGSNVIAK